MHGLIKRILSSKRYRVTRSGFRRERLEHEWRLGEQQWRLSEEGVSQDHVMDSAAAKGAEAHRRR
jgi:hypothetical protein